MSFIRVWFIGYYNPAKMIEELRSRPAPHMVIATIGLKRILGVPVWLGALLSFLGIPIALPLGIMFMRSPL